jgi:hypothetical protein
LFRCTFDGAIGIAFEEGRKAREFEDRVIETQDSECDCVVLSDES